MEVCLELLHGGVASVAGNWAGVFSARTPLSRSFPPTSSPMEFTRSFPGSHHVTLYRLNKCSSRHQRTISANMNIVFRPMFERRFLTLFRSPTNNSQ